jgi:succinyl-diaminopimelate desuccinylase
MAVDPIALARDLIRAPSVTPKDAGALPLLATVLEAEGFACELMEFAEPGTEPVLNLYARRGRSGRNFCFAGHSDVVPPGDPAHWRADPFAGTVVDGALLGRGAADMKGAIAAFVAAAARFGTAFDGSVSLLVTGDEEGDRVNGTRKVLERLAARGERLDACIVGEPTSAAVLGDTIKIGRRGSLYAYLTALGSAGHVAYPHLADNAAHRLVAMLAALTAAPLDPGTAHFPPSSLQVASLATENKTDNVIPGTAAATIAIRFNDLWSTETIEAWIRKTLDATGGRYALSFRESAESFLIPPGPLSDLVAQAVERVTGRRPELNTTGGTSDACFIHRYCPVVELGLVGATMHKPDERVPLADLETLAEIYGAALELYFRP